MTFADGLRLSPKYRLNTCHHSFDPQSWDGSPSFVAGQPQAVTPKFHSQTSLKHLGGILIEVKCSDGKPACLTSPPGNFISRKIFFLLNYTLFSIYIYYNSTLYYLAYTLFNIALLAISNYHVFLTTELPNRE